MVTYAFDSRRRRERAEYGNKRAFRPAYGGGYGFFSQRKVYSRASDEEPRYGGIDYDRGKDLYASISGGYGGSYGSSSYSPPQRGNWYEDRDLGYGEYPIHGLQTPITHSIPSNPLSLALLVDCENISAKFVSDVLEIMNVLGDCNIRELYGNFRSPHCAR